MKQLVLLIALAAAAACGQTTPEYQIHSGDQLDIKLYYHPELNESVTVRPDGRISLQLVNDVVADGLTPKALSLALSAAYGQQLKMADAVVIVRSFSQQKIFVDGEVGRPGVLNLAPNETLLQAIAEAGGMKDTGRVKNIIVIRRGEDGKPMVVRGDALYANVSAASDIPLRPYDVIYLPRSSIANVNRWVDQYLRKNIPITFGFLSNGGFLP